MMPTIPANLSYLDRGSTVAIVGGGFSGTMQAINLLRHDGPAAVLIERRPARLGRGVAYSAAHPDHLLNVRAANMSAFPDDPGHFVRWLAQENIGDGGMFVPRTVYGRYLRAMLDDAARGAGSRLRIVDAAAIDMEQGEGGLAIALAEGGVVRADAAVLAMGNLPPHPPTGFDSADLGADLFAEDPWAGDIAQGLVDTDTVLLLGTGLTAVDAALLLDARGFRGQIIALSRRGLLPHAHWDQPRQACEIAELPPTRASDLTRFIRQRAERKGWRDAVDDLRPLTQRLWSAASREERERFLRHLRPYWDIHRHRLAPQVAGRIAELRSIGQLRVVAGKTLDCVRSDAGLSVSWRPRGACAPERLTVRRVVNCTGPQGDLLRTTDPLLTRLLANGTIRPDPLRLGLDADQQSRVIGKSGHPNDRIFAIGPMTRGGLWEVVAVPDIRHQTWALARRLANAHWVGGEGL